MIDLFSFFSDIPSSLTPLYFQAQEWFCTQTEQWNFPLFCLIYSICFLLIGRLFFRRQRWRASNKELKTWKQRTKDWLFNMTFELPFLKAFVYGKFNEELEKQEALMIKQFQSSRDQRKSNTLPYDGMTEEHLRKRIEEWKKKQNQVCSTGKISGSLYTTDQQHWSLSSQFASKYLYQNPLHLDTFKHLLKMESEVLQMTSSLLTQTNKYYPGVLTSGGSQSLILSIYAHRKFYSSRTKPNIVIPVTAHAAIDKGCFYLNIEARKARLTAEMKVDISHMKSLIDRNTIMIIGSAPNYPHGIIDPIEELAKLAKSKNVGFHVDGCLGGFIGAFHPKFKELYSLDREGVTSVSIDHHKFGLAPKGVSSVFYKTKELRHCQYFSTAQWIGGLYATPSIPGSRSGFGSAGAWYSMTQLTRKQYKYNAEQISKATQESARRLRQISGIEMLGDPQLCVIAFRCTEISSLDLADYLNHEYSWGVSSLHKPVAIHVSLTLANYENVVNKLPEDVKKGLKALETEGVKKKSASSKIYGANTEIPTGHMQEEVLRCVVGASMK